jgi:DNA-binding protein HU-beta
MCESMNKQELAMRLAETTDMPRSDAARAIDAMLDIITDALARGEEVRLVGFGNFVAGVRKASTGRNPRTGEPMDLAETIVPKFRVGRNLKDACNKVSCDSNAGNSNAGNHRANGLAG